MKYGKKKYQSYGQLRDKAIQQRKYQREAN